MEIFKELPVDVLRRVAGYAKVMGRMHDCCECKRMFIPPTSSWSGCGERCERCRGYRECPWYTKYSDVCHCVDGCSFCGADICGRCLRRTKMEWLDGDQHACSKCLDSYCFTCDNQRDDVVKCSKCDLTHCVRHSTHKCRNPACDAPVCAGCETNCDACDATYCSECEKYGNTVRYCQECEFSVCIDHFASPTAQVCKQCHLWTSWAT